MPVYSGTKDQWKCERITGVTYAKKIEKPWNTAELLEVGLEKYVTPVDPLILSITRTQFKAVLRINNLLDVVKTEVNIISNARAKAIAISKFEENDTYKRNDPLFALMGANLNLTDAQIDAIWLQALEIE